MIKKAFVDKKSNLILATFSDCKKKQLQQPIEQLAQITGDTDTDENDIEKINNKYRIAFFFSGDPQNRDYDPIYERLTEFDYQIVQK